MSKNKEKRAVKKVITRVYSSRLKDLAILWALAAAVYVVDYTTTHWIGSAAITLINVIYTAYLVHRIRRTGRIVSNIPWAKVNSAMSLEDGHTRICVNNSCFDVHMPVQAGDEVKVLNTVDGVFGVVKVA